MEKISSEIQKIIDEEVSKNISSKNVDNNILQKFEEISNGTDIDKKMKECVENWIDQINDNKEYIITYILDKYKSLKEDKNKKIYRDGIENEKEFFDEFCSDRKEMFSVDISNCLYDINKIIKKMMP